MVDDSILDIVKLLDSAAIMSMALHEKETAKIVRFRADTLSQNSRHFSDGELV